MDPNECYRQMTSSKVDPIEAFHRAVDLFNWLESGGSLPDGISLSEAINAMQGVACWGMLDLGYQVHKKSKKKGEAPNGP